MLETLLIGAAGGVLVLLVEHGIIYVKDRKKESRSRVVSFPNTDRTIDENIFINLSPGHSVELMRTALGTPDKTYKDSDPAFEYYTEDDEGERFYGFENDEEREAYEKKIEVNAYYYVFKNAAVKITSKDGLTIESLAVEMLGGALKVGVLPLGWVTSDESDDEPLILGKSKVSAELVEQCEPAMIRNRFDNIFVLSLSTGSPLFTYYTYFGFPDYEDDVVPSAEHPETFIGSEISGVCLHRSRESCFVMTYFDAI